MLKYISILLTTLFFSCVSNPTDVTMDYNDGTSFSHLKSFHWYDSLKVKHPVDQLMDRRFHNAIIRTLQKQGFTQSNEKTDFLVNYAVSTKTKQEIKSYSSVGEYYGGLYMPMDQDVELRDYHTTMVFVDFVDPKTKNLLWRGMGKRRLPSHMTHKDRDEIVNQMIGKILAQFPPK